MPSLLADIDPEGLLEYSVVYNDRSLNHMSQAFQGVMKDISATLKEVYNADAVIVVPGGGTYGMEAVSRQFAKNKKCLVVRNGWFSYRWSQILEMADIPASTKVLKAEPVEQGDQPAYAPAAIEDVIRCIKSEKPDIVFAPHVETASGMLLPDEYIKAIADAVHDHGGLFVLDCVASGTLWVDMKSLRVDVLISAPQKGWSGSPCAALVMLNQSALDRMVKTASDSFACDLKKWHQIMEAYEQGGHAYHSTLPTDALSRFRDVMLEIKDCGFGRVRDLQLELGNKIRDLLRNNGFKDVAAKGFQAPGVIVNYTCSNDLQNGKLFAAYGIQAATGVPLQCDEATNFKTFRLGLFGLDKLQNIERTVTNLQNVLAQIRSR